MFDPTLTDEQRVSKIDDELSHVWMVRRFLKHCDEAEDDPELQDITRVLYDYMLAVGPARTQGDHPLFLKQAKKKLRKLRDATTLFVEIQPEVSGHTNFAMAARSLRLAVGAIVELVESAAARPPSAEPQRPEEL